MSLDFVNVAIYKNSFKKNEIILIMEYFREVDSSPNCVHAPWQVSPLYFESPCDFDLLIAQTVAEVLNITAIHRLGSIDRRKLRYGFQLSSFSEEMEQWSGALFFVGGYGQRIIYCVDSYTSFSFKVWLSPYTFSAWLVIFIVCLTLPPFLWRRDASTFLNVCETILNLVAILLRQTIAEKYSRSVIVVSYSLTFILISSLYENYLTSQLIVPDILAPFASLGEVILAGYCIVTLQWGNFSTPTRLIYEMDYKRNGILELINSTTREYFGASWEPEEIRSFVARQFAILEISVDGFYSDLVLQKTKVVLGKKAGKECHKIPGEVLGASVYFSKYVFHIGQIFADKVQSLRESGHLGWFMYDLRGLIETKGLRDVEKEEGFEDEGSSGFISIKHLLSFFSLSLFGMVVSGIVFGIEKYYGMRDKPCTA